MANKPSKLGLDMSRFSFSTIGSTVLLFFAIRRIWVRFWLFECLLLVMALEVHGLSCAASPLDTVALIVVPDEEGRFSRMKVLPGPS